MCGGRARSVGSRGGWRWLRGVGAVCTYCMFVAVGQFVWNCGGGFVGAVWGAGVGTLFCVDAGLVLVLGLVGCLDGRSVGGVGGVSVLR